MAGRGKKAAAKPIRQPTDEDDEKRGSRDFLFVGGPKNGEHRRMSTYYTKPVLFADPTWAYYRPEKGKMVFADDLDPNPRGHR